MANEEHVAILKKGVEAWNAWRDENPDIRLDFSNAFLQKVELSWYRSKPPDWLKMKNADAPAVKREEEEDWRKGR